MSASEPELPPRLLSIDQLRGYAIFGMILVNAKGMFGVKIDQLSHHQNCFTYADTVAPIFMFVVGLSMRLSWLRRSKVAGAVATRKAMARRFSILVLIAFALYMGWLWDALMDIGLAGLLAVAFIDKSAIVRAGAASCMALAYQALVSFTVYGPWVMRTTKLTEENIPYLFKWIPYRSTLFDVALNGGPFGPLSWCFILLMGTIACDILRRKDHGRIMIDCLSLGIALCATGWVMSMPWGEVKPVWPISAYHMTLPFPLWSTGICFLTLLAFYLLCDVGRIKIPTFSTVSFNALFIYILQCVISETEAPQEIIKACYGWIQQPLTAWNPILAQPLGICGILVYYLFLASVAYALERKKIFIKV